MTTLTVPPVIPSPREDAKKLHKAFKGLNFYLYMHIKKNMHILIF